MDKKKRKVRSKSEQTKKEIKTEINTETITEIDTEIETETITDIDTEITTEGNKEKKRKPRSSKKEASKASLVFGKITDFLKTRLCGFILTGIHTVLTIVL